MRYLLFLLLLGSASAASNDEILDYLGSPVVYKTSEPRFSPAKLKEAFVAASKKSGVAVESLSVDSSEFPPLLYGKLAEKSSLSKVLGNLGDGYEYSGSSTGAFSFAVNLIPYKEMPKKLIKSVFKRLAVRSAILNEKVNTK